MSVRKPVGWSTARFPRLWSLKVVSHKVSAAVVSERAQSRDLDLLWFELRAKPGSFVEDIRAIIPTVAEL